MPQLLKNKYLGRINRKLQERSSIKEGSKIIVNDSQVPPTGFDI
jgi:hypothetical protein